VLLAFKELHSHCKMMQLYSILNGSYSLARPGNFLDGEFRLLGLIPFQSHSKTFWM